MSPSERLAQALSQAPGTDCSEQGSALRSAWSESAAPLIRGALTKSERWRTLPKEPLIADASNGQTAFQASLTEVNFRPAIVLGNQSVSLGQSCDQARAHFSLHELEIEALTSMSACINVPNVGRRCDKTKVRLVGRAKNAMISVDILPAQDGFKLGEPTVLVRLTEISLSEGSTPDRRTSVVFSRFQASWEEAIAHAFEEGMKGAIVGAISQLKCDMGALRCD